MEIGEVKVLENGEKILCEKVPFTTVENCCKRCVGENNDVLCELLPECLGGKIFTKFEEV